MTAKRIVIIGGGFSGTMLAHHLRDTYAGVTLVEQAPPPGLGIAYGRCSEEMLLNVPVEKMGADEEGSFLTWCLKNGRSIRPGEYVERAFYSRFLREFIPPASEKFRAVSGEAVRVAVSGNAAAAELADGTKLEADAIVLACGNLPRKKFFGSALGSPSIFGDPWADSGWREHGGHEAVLIGASLTAVDVALRLLADPKRRVFMISRHGKLPHSHRAGHGTALLPVELFSAKNATRALGIIRKAADRAENWRDVMNALRLRTEELWQSLPPGERRRFMRHALTYWNIHRHRIPGEIAARLEAASASGRLKLIAAKAGEITARGSALEIRYRPRGTAAPKTLRADFVVNCLGPADSPAEARGALFAQLIADKLIRPHSSGAGIEVEPGGFQVLQESGKPSPIFTIGHWLRGDRFECTAVPDLRGQAKALAAILSR